MLYALRRCELCGVIARTSNGRVKPQSCKVCKEPAKHIQLGSAYCDAHLVKIGKLRTLDDMSVEEIRKLEKQYGMPVKKR
jgi:hypothetical protein